MLRFTVLVSWGLLTGVLHAAEWQPKKAPLMTRWAKDVSPEKVHPEYPRSQMVREKWVNLNEQWDYAIVERSSGGSPESAAGEPPAPRKWDGKILVPFPVESALSGVMKRVPDNGKLWYRRSFATPEMVKDGRLLLHFGASDWETVVSINGEHRGSYRRLSRPRRLGDTRPTNPKRVGRSPASMTRPGSPAPADSENLRLRRLS